MLRTRTLKRITPEVDIYLRAVTVALPAHFAGRILLGLDVEQDLVLAVPTHTFLILGWRAQAAISITGECGRARAEIEASTFNRSLMVSGRGQVTFSSREGKTPTSI
jgi:hypothetical protein